MSNFYILKDKTPVKVAGVKEWCTEGFGQNKQVARDTFGQTLVSTVFLGIDHNHYGGEPILFETMIFGGKHDGYQTRCSTWDEAIEQHEEACKLVSNKFVLWVRRKLKTMNI
jgi:hypothetical protein